MIGGILLTLAVSSVVAFRGWPGLSSTGDIRAAAVLDAGKAAPTASPRRRATLGRGKAEAVGSSPARSPRAGRSRAATARRSRIAMSGRAVAPARSHAPEAPQPAAPVDFTPAAPRGGRDRVRTVVPEALAPRPTVEVPAADPVRGVVEDVTGAVDGVTQTDIAQQVGDVLLDVRDALP